MQYTALVYNEKRRLVPVCWVEAESHQMAISKTITELGRKDRKFTMKRWIDHGMMLTIGIKWV